MSDYKLVPIGPTPEMVEAAESAYMPFGDMEMAIRMAVLAAPAVQGEPSRESSMVVLERDEHGKPAVWCDPEIADLVSALNDAGICTVASCSGHGHRPGNIMLADGRELVIARDFDEARKVDAMFPGINGEPPAVQGEPVGEVRFELGAPSSIFAELYSKSLPVLAPGTKLYAAPQPEEQQPDVTQLVEALESLIKGYVGLLEAGMDRITSLGGDCDPVPVMEQNDPWLRDARAALAAHRKQQEGQP